MNCMGCAARVESVYACMAEDRCLTAHLCMPCLQAHARARHAGEAVYAIACCRGDTVRLAHIVREASARLRDAPVAAGRPMVSP
ncbi:MAG TPA: hypothetical protein VNE82_12745 [Candidatus Binataceae bacterium]|nr:hypothetical protein [Candidatus Binataceae bacterium]HVB80799.1 hypothetical protein [Candidatus Binataceae bacterium]